MIKQYVRADTNFNKKKFRRFVEERIVPGAKGNAEVAKEIREQVEGFLSSVERQATQ